MNTDNDWRLNEFRQIGTDYSSVEEVREYDSRMRKFRDIEAENRQVLDLLRADGNSVLLEIGTGTGAFARTAGRCCASVTALDISDVMLSYASLRAAEEKLRNVEFVKAGFLSYDYKPEYFDGAVSSLALHHLPDTWKAVALRNIHKCLKPGGRLVLTDVVFNWENESPETYFSRIVERAPGSRVNFAKHIACEYSTLTWVMNGLLERAGFIIEKDECKDEFLHFYCCVKRGDSSKRV